MTAKKKILITGYSSELMQHLVAHIDIEQYEISGLLRSKSKIKVMDFNIIEGDLSNYSLMNKIVSGYDIIIHAAGITHSFKSKPYFKINYNHTKNLVDTAQKNNIERFIYISSRAAGKKSGAYGKSKYLAEEYVKEKLDNWLIFRPSEVFGSNKKEGVEKLIHDAISKKWMLYPMGVKSKLFPIHIEDLASIMAKNIFDKKLSSRTIIINGSKGYTNKELILKVCALINKKILIIPIPKIVMYTTKLILEVIPFQIGIVPDQIPRLYSNKEYTKVDHQMLEIEDYIIWKGYNQ